MWSIWRMERSGHRTGKQRMVVFFVQNHTQLSCQGHKRSLSPGDISVLTMGTIQSPEVQDTIVLTAVVKIDTIRLDLSKNLKNIERHYGEMGHMFLFLNAVIGT